MHKSMTFCFLFHLSLSRAFRFPLLSVYSMCVVCLFVPTNKSVLFYQMNGISLILQWHSLKPQLTNQNIYRCVSPYKTLCCHKNTNRIHSNSHVTVQIVVRKMLNIKRKTAFIFNKIWNESRAQGENDEDTLNPIGSARSHKHHLDSHIHRHTHKW